MKKLIFIIFGVLLSYFIISYQYSAHKTFDDLNYTFNNWYKFNHPIDFNNYDLKQNLLYSKRDEYYLADIKNFQLEISQIDFKKLDYRRLNELNSMNSLCDNLVNNYLEQLVDYSYNVQHIEYLLTNILFSENIDDDHKIIALENLINFSSEYLLDNLKAKKSEYYINNFQSIEYLDNILFLIKNHEIFIEDNQSNLSEHDVKKFVDFIELIKEDLFLASDKQNIDFYKKNTKFEKTEYSDIIVNIKHDIKKLKNEVFDLAYDIYISQDENNNHILLDLKDTLNVINEVLSYKNSNSRDFDTNKLKLIERIDLFKNNLSYQDSIFEYKIFNFYNYDINHMNINLNYFKFDRNNIAIIYNDDNHQSIFEDAKNSLSLYENIFFDYIIVEYSNKPKYCFNKNYFYGWKQLFLESLNLNNSEIFISKLNQLRYMNNILAKDMLVSKSNKDKEIIDFIKEAGFYQGTNEPKFIYNYLIKNPTYNNIDDYLYFVKIKKQYDEMIIINEKLNKTDFFYRLLREEI